MSKNTKNTAKTPVDRSMADAPPAERKTALIKALRQRKASTQIAAVSIGAMAEKLGYTKFDVYGLVSGTSGKAGSSPTCLMATGHVKTAFIEEQGLSVYLTAKGLKTEFDEVPFVRATPAAKPAKKAAAPKKATAKATAKAKPARKAPAKSSPKTGDPATDQATEAATPVE